MRVTALLLCLAILTFVAIARAQKLQVTILESTADGQSYDVPARVACVPGQFGPLCAARGAETVNTYTIRSKARLVRTGAGMWLTCDLRKRGDEKHCSKLLPGTYQAEAKGNDKLIVYAWANPVYVGNFSKATKLEFKVGARELEKDKLAGAKPERP
jgi:hypothetical protein